MDCIVDQMISLNRGSFEMPAGTGKTQRIVTGTKELLKQGKKALVLTHTNAGVAALNERFQRLSINGGTDVTISTIASFAERLVMSYPETSELDMTINRQDSDYFSDCITAATRLIAVDFCADMLARSFHVLIVDEYQDCDYGQHLFIAELARVVQKAFVFGDRLQSLFEFGGARIPHWESEVEAVFPRLDVGAPVPYRWAKENEPLGDWLLNEARPSFLEGHDPDYLAAEGVIEWKRFGSEIGQRQRELAATFREFSMCDGYSLIVGDSRARGKRVQLAKMAGGRFQLIEDVQGKALYQEVHKFDDCKASGRNIASWLIDLAKECFTGLSNLDKTIQKAVSDGRPLEKYKVSRAEISEIIDVLNEVMVNQSPNSLCLAGTVFERCSRVRLYCADEWRYVLQSACNALMQGTSASEQLDVLRSRLRYGRRISDRSIGSVLHVKGLEFDNVLIPDMRYLTSSQEKYVALTRPKRRLIIIV